MQAAREERQEQAEGERKKRAFTGMGPPASPPLLGDYAGTQSGAGRRAGAPGEPSVRRVSSVESGAGVCARGLPHILYHQHPAATLHTSPQLPPRGSCLSGCLHLPSLSSLSTCHMAVHYSSLTLTGILPLLIQIL